MDNSKLRRFQYSLIGLGLLNASCFLPVAMDVLTSVPVHRRSEMFPAASPFLVASLIFLVAYLLSARYPRRLLSNAMEFVTLVYLLSIVACLASLGIVRILMTVAGVAACNLFVLPLKPSWAQPKPAKDSNQNPYIGVSRPG